MGNHIARQLAFTEGGNDENYEIQKELQVVRGPDGAAFDCEIWDTNQAMFDVNEIIDSHVLE